MALLIWLLWLFAVSAAFVGTIVAVLYDGSKLQPSAQEILIRRCEEQHAAIMRGDTRLGVYGQYPPAV